MTIADAATVPKFDATVYAARRSRYAVVVLVINENGRIRSQLVKMQPLAGAFDIVVADGGSTDGSLDDAFLRAHGVRALLVKRDTGRLGAQQRMAIDWTMREGYEGVIVVDGNDKDDTGAVPRFAERLDAGDDHVQGSRYVPGGRGVNTPPLRHWGVRLVHAPLVSWAAGTKYTDTTNGFRAWSRRLLTDDRVQPLRAVFTGYELHYYLAIRAGELGFRVSELPVTRVYPAAGPVPTKISPVRGNLVILATLLKACLHRFDPATTERDA